MPRVDRAHLMGPQEIDLALTRMAHEIIADAPAVADLVVLGIPSRGAPLAERLSEKIAEIAPSFQPAQHCGQLDVTMYRDDLRSQPTRTLKPTHTPDVTNKHVVLVDDVFYSGRTIRAALDALNDFGRPAAVRLAVLIDRGHRELPIRPDFIGGTLATETHQKVRVLVNEFDEIDAVVIENTLPQCETK